MKNVGNIVKDRVRNRVRVRVYDRLDQKQSSITET